jgi:23S rRNA pseudouridine1911/1915/1917 synthase
MEVLFEDNHLIAVYKAPGDIVQGDKTGDRTLADDVKEYIARKYHKPGDVFLGIMHRLDRPTSGVVMFARTSKALVRMNEMLRDHKVEKTYWAIVGERPPMPTATLTHYLKKNEETNKSHVHDFEVKDSKKAVLSYVLLGATENYNLLEVKLETGRHHQIRAQLAKIGCPIKGDLKYGFTRSNKDGSISLHARRVRFLHPVTKVQIDIVCPVPNDPLWAMFDRIGKNAQNM